MAQLSALAAPLFAGSSILKTVSTINEGRVADDESKFAARVMRMRANEEAGVSQRRALKAKKDTERAVSRARAVAAASGAGADDPTVNDIIDDLETEGELAALNELYTGRVREQNMKTNARLTRSEGAKLQRKSVLDAAGGLMADVSTLYSRYGSRT